MTKTFKDLFEFLTVANTYTEDDKLKYAFDKMKNQKNGRLQNAMETWNETLADLQYDHASLDEKGNLLRDEKNQLKFTVPKQKEFDKAVKELRKKTFDFEPYYATELPKDLNEFTLDILTGFVVKEKVQLEDSNGHEKIKEKVK